jgi:hypothetical protein
MRFARHARASYGRSKVEKQTSSRVLRRKSGIHSGSLPAQPANSSRGFHSAILSLNVRAATASRGIGDDEDE